MVRSGRLRNHICRVHACNVQYQFQYHVQCHVSAGIIDPQPAFLRLGASRQRRAAARGMPGRQAGWPAPARTLWDAEGQGPGWQAGAVAVPGCNCLPLVQALAAAPLLIQMQVERPLLLRGRGTRLQLSAHRCRICQPGRRHCWL